MRTPKTTRVLFALAASLCALPPLATALSIEWVAGTADWFLPGNWNPNVVPGAADSAFINNGGTAQVSAGAARALVLYLGRNAGSSGSLSVSGGTLTCGDGDFLGIHLGISDGSVGSVTQSGGTVASNLLVLGPNVGSSGTYNLTNGALNLGLLLVGYGEYDVPAGTGSLIQSGGTLGASQLHVGVDGGGAGQCSFTGGAQSFGRVEVRKTGTVAVSGSAALSTASLGVREGDVNQTGGGVTVSGGLTVSGTGASYNLSGAGTTLSAGSLGVSGQGQFNQTAGAATAGSILVGNQGLVNQSGGDMDVTTLLTVGAGGRYAYTGGTLHIGTMWNLEGQFDLGGHAVTVNVGSVPTASSVSLWNGTISNGGNASLNVFGADSFVVLAPGQNNAFGSFYNEGTTYFTGGTLVVQAGKTVRLAGTFPDHAQVQGTLTNVGGYLNLGNGLEVSGSGVVNLGWGTLKVLDSVSGVANSGQLSAGTIRVAETGTASFALSGGQVSTMSFEVGPNAPSRGTLSISGGVLTCGGEDPGTLSVGGASGSIGSVKQSGGTVNCGALVLGRDAGSTGSYTLTSGAVNVHCLTVGLDTEWWGATTGSLTQIGGVLNGSEAFVGAPAGSGTGQASLSGGTQTFNQRVRVYNTGTLGVSGSAALSTGSLEVPGGDVNQSGGGVTVSGGLTLNGAGSSYNISAGGLRVWDLNVDNGLFNISGSGANIEVRNNLRFGPNGTFQAVPGSAIHMTGAAFQNERTSPAALAGLHSLALIFEGGAATVDTFEVAGRDLGPLPEGFVDNFELGRLILGGADIGNVRLVDYLDNLLTWPENQALYVNYLEVGSNSRLDLNGLNLYYMDASIDPTALIEYGGGQLRQMVPEPMTLLVLGGGLLAVLRRRIRK